MEDFVCMSWDKSCRSGAYVFLRVGVLDVAFYGVLKAVIKNTESEELGKMFYVCNPFRCIKIGEELACISSVLRLSKAPLL